MDYMLETRGLTKRFGRGDQAQDAVADVSLHIREGEVYGLLGPNGAGKSTTLKMICGMLRPTAGEILFAGHAWRREDLYAIGSLIEEAPTDQVNYWNKYSDTLVHYSRYICVNRRDKYSPYSAVYQLRVCRFTSR